MVPLENVTQFEPAHSSHADVDNGQIEPFVFDRNDGLFRIAGFFGDAIPIRQDHTENLSHRGVVVYNEDGTDGGGMWKIRIGCSHGQSDGSAQKNFFPSLFRVKDALEKFAFVFSRSFLGGLIG